jgi:hypothetical protein
MNQQRQHDPNPAPLSAEQLLELTRAMPVGLEDTVGRQSGISAKMTP